MKIIVFFLLLVDVVTIAFGIVQTTTLILGLKSSFKCNLQELSWCQHLLAWGLVVSTRHIEATPVGRFFSLLRVGVFIFKQIGYLRAINPNCYQSLSYTTSRGVLQSTWVLAPTRKNSPVCLRFRWQLTLQDGLLPVTSRVLTPLIGVITPVTPFIRPFIGTPSLHLQRS